MSSLKFGKKPKGLITFGQWYKQRRFEDRQEAKGAYDLAHLQYLDGMGASREDWIGLTPEEERLFCQDKLEPFPTRVVTHWPVK